MTTATKNGTTKDAASTALIQIDQIAEERLRVPIIGITPLISHRFSEKAKREMLYAAQGRKSPKEPKDPEAEYQAAFYRLADEGYGHPVEAVKDATVGAARFYGKELSMTGLKQFIFFRGELGDDGRQLIRIEGDPVMREDVVRVGRGGADLRYRPQFYPWTAVLDVTYFTSVLTRDSILSLIDAGGKSIGIGEWRPQRDGTFGTYKIDLDQDIEVLQ